MGHLLPLGGAKQRAVLALLLLRANEVVPIDRLIDELWGDSPPESAANMLQGYVSDLRKALEPGRTRGEHELLVSQAPGYALHIRQDQLDANRFARLASEGRQLLDDNDPGAAAERLRAALELWRGPALADLAYEAFARPEAERLEELRLATMEDRIDADLALGRHDALVGELRELVDAYPLRERARGQLMAALYRGGRQAEALQVYREGRASLSEQLGIEPGPGLRELERAILRQDSELGAQPIRRRRSNEVAPPAGRWSWGSPWPPRPGFRSCSSAAVRPTRGPSSYARTPLPSSTPLATNSLPTFPLETGPARSQPTRLTCTSATSATRLLAHPARSS